MIACHFPCAYRQSRTRPVPSSLSPRFRRPARIAFAKSISLSSANGSHTDFARRSTAPSARTSFRSPRRLSTRGLPRFLLLAKSRILRSPNFREARILRVSPSFVSRHDKPPPLVAHHLTQPRGDWHPPELFLLVWWLPNPALLCICCRASRFLTSVLLIWDRRAPFPKLRF